jgi:hypothetical protein
MSYENHGRETSSLTCQTHDDGELVSTPTEDFTGNGRECEIAGAKVGDLKSRRLKLGDSKSVLKVLVENIEQTIRESPCMFDRYMS